MFHNSYPLTKLFGHSHWNHCLDKRSVKWTELVFEECAQGQAQGGIREWLPQWQTVSTLVSDKLMMEKFHTALLALLIIDSVGMLLHPHLEGLCSILSFQWCAFHDFAHCIITVSLLYVLLLYKLCMCLPGRIKSLPNCYEHDQVTVPSWPQRQWSGCLSVLLKTYWCININK